jgi:dihydrofolate reductase
MRKLSVNSFVTLDGVMQAPGGPEEDPSGGFKHGGWSVNYWDGLMGQIMSDYMAKPFELLLGRKTYEIFAAHWPYSKEDPAAKILNAAKKYVVSKKLNSVEWNNSSLLKGDIVQEIKKLKTQNGPEIQVHGSSNLIQTLLKNNLADEMQIWIFPVTVGGGKRLFGDGTIPAGFKLLESRISETGVIISTYKPGGELKVGSFALENPTGAEFKRREKLKAESNL